MANFTSVYMALLKRNGLLQEITNEGAPISTIIISEPMRFKYNQPRIIYDKFQRKQAKLEPDIKKITDSYENLKELGFVIVSKSVGNNRWRKKQLVEYSLAKINMVADDANVISYIPNGHWAEYDKNNSCIRLVGKNCQDRATGIKSITAWIKI